MEGYRFVSVGEEEIFGEDWEEDAVMRILSGEGVPEGGYDTLRVAKKVLGRNATKKDINPLLYRMEREGKVRRVTLPGKRRPRWKIV